jgi:hypothetical protein
MQASKGFLSIFRQATLSVEDARGKLGYAFKQNENFTHLFFLDDDVVCPDGTIEKLLAHNLDVVSANYPLYIEGRIHSCGYEWDSDKKIKPYPIGTRGLREVGAIGLGACLIKREVFLKALKYPCFAMGYNEGYSMKRTDDVTFCRYLSFLKVPIYVDFDICCDHFKSVSLNTAGKELGWGKQTDCMIVTNADSPTKSETLKEIEVS